MGLTVKEYPSKSNPGKKYSIIKAADETYYCDCWTWKKNKSCNHLKDFLFTDKVQMVQAALKGEPNDKIDDIINQFFPKFPK